MFNFYILVLSVTWCFLVTSCSAEKTLDSNSVLGKRCCPNDSSSDSCSSLSEVDDFSPLVTFREPLKPITWTPSPVICPQSYQLKYFDLHNTSKNKLYVRDGEMKLAWFDVYYRTTRDYCVERREESTQYFAAICRPVIQEVCAGALCVTKCCGLNEEWRPLQQYCMPTTHTHFNLTFHTVNGQPALPHTQPVIVDQAPECENPILLEPHNDDKDSFYVLPNGQLYFISLKTKHNPGKYCVDYNANDEVMAGVMCHEPHKSHAITVKDQLTTAGVFISAVFLTITIIIHLVTPELRDMQGRCLLSHMSALLIANVAQFTIYFSSAFTSVQCVVIGMVLQFSFLATFFWLNVMCFDIWRVIRATVNLIPLSGILEKDRKKFRLYSLYAWIGPALITIVTVIMHHTPRQPDNPALIIPDFGEITCFLHADLPRLAYFNGIAAFLFTINIGFLVHTIYLLFNAGGAFQCCTTKQVNVNSFNRTHLQAFWQRFSLFIVMAFCWVTEILSWKIPPPELWIFTDILNSLQGFMVFVIFISSRKKRDNVKTVWNGAMSRLSNAARKLSTTDASGSTSNAPSTAVSHSVPKDSRHTPSSEEESTPCNER